MSIFSFKKSMYGNLSTWRKVAFLILILGTISLSLYETIDTFIPYNGASNETGVVINTTFTHSLVSMYANRVTVLHNGEKIIVATEFKNSYGDKVDYVLLKNHGPGTVMPMSDIYQVIRLFFGVALFTAVALVPILLLDGPAIRKYQRDKR